MSRRRSWGSWVFIAILGLFLAWAVFVISEIATYGSMGRPSDSYSGSIRFKDRRSLEDYQLVEEPSIDKFIDAYVTVTGAKVTSKDANTYVSGCKTVDGSYNTRSQHGTMKVSKETMLALGQTYLVSAGYTNVKYYDYGNGGYNIDWKNPKQGGLVSIHLYYKDNNKQQIRIDASSGCRPTDGSTTLKLNNLFQAAQSTDTTQSDDQQSR